MIVIDFIDMVLESNRDLVLRRLTEALARDRTRHQVSEVTSLGLVQLTRKRLGTGLIEAFSTTCPHCSGRGIMLHGDPVDSTPTIGRKSESGGRRGRRSKKGKAEEPAVATVPAHAPGEHPMFKAMAAANGGHHEDDEMAHDEDTEDVPVEQHEGDAEADEQLQQQVAEETAEEDLEDDDFDDVDDDDSDDDDTDQVDLDDDDDLDDEYDDFDDSDDEDDDEDDEFDDGDDDDEDSDQARQPQLGAATGSDGRPRRRRAAARPAGPPAHDD
jgi:ribonuclease E